MSDDKSKMNYGRGSRQNKQHDGQGMSRPKIPQIAKREFVEWDDTLTPRQNSAAHNPSNTGSAAHNVNNAGTHNTPIRSQREALAEAERLLEQASNKSKQNRPKQNRLHRTMTIFLIIFALLGVMMLGVLWLVSSQLRPQAGNIGGVTMMLALLRNVNPAAHNDFENTESFEVLSGWSANRVAQELEKQGFVQDARLFSYFLRWQGADTKIGEGLYEISPAMNPWQLAEVLEQGGNARSYSILIPEGYRDVEVADTLRAHYQGEVRQKDFLWHIRGDASLRPAFIAPEVSTGLEGYLFPARYEVVANSEPATIIGDMLERFAQELDAATLGAIEDMGLSVHEWVILASIVQSEAGSEGEMPVIAGVFHNRLERGMMLQSDPTVAYGLNKPMNQLSAAAGDFTPSADHAWNTYTRTGLPLGPISNPGHAALQAVLRPIRQNHQGQDWLYFLHDRQGGFHPNLNLADHNADVQRYLR